MDTTILDSTQGKGTQNQTAKSHGTIAGVTGAVLGASGSVIIGKIVDDVQTHEKPLVEENIELVDKNGQEIVEDAEVTKDSPSWVVGDIQIAEGVEDSMSFNQAFATARAEVGPGGAFEWRGTVYGTYYADEWNAMTDAEKAEYNGHFNWNNIHANSAATDEDSNDAITDVEVVSTESPTATDLNHEPEIEVLGVVHDYDSGANIGGMTIDGQGVVLIDVDGDLEFDIAVSDLNHDGQIEYGEAIDIHGNGLTVDQLGGFINPEDGIPASEDSVADYDDPYFNV